MFSFLEDACNFIIGGGGEDGEVIRDFLFRHFNEDRLGGEQHFIGPGRPAVTGIEKHGNTLRIEFGDIIKNSISKKRTIL